MDKNRELYLYLYIEWKRQQPVNYTRESDGGHSSKRVRDYSKEEEIIGFEMDDPEIMMHLGLFYAVLPDPPVAHLFPPEEED